MEFSEFSSLVSSMARKSNINSNWTVEDLEQELWCKLFSIFPTIERKSRAEVFGYVKACLKNYIIDIVTSESHTPGSSDIDSRDIDFSEVVSDECSLLFENLVDKSGPIDFLEKRESAERTRKLYSFIKDWSTSKESYMKKYIDEALDTSEEIKVKWNVIKNSPGRTRGRNTDYIPPFSLASMVGINKTQLYKTIITLKSDLKAAGFEV